MKATKKTDLEYFCRFCENAHYLQSPDQVLCDKKGIVQSSYHCHSFRYDPLKRNPHMPKPIPSLEKDQED